MRHPLPRLRPFCAKLVIAVSAVVAVATSAPPRWQATQARDVSVLLDDTTARELRVTLDLDGALYADAYSGELLVTATGDRAASDLVLSARRLTPGAEESAGAALDGGVLPDGDAQSASPALEAPNRASVWVSVGCVTVAGGERSEACQDMFLVRLAHASQRPLNVQLHVEATLGGNVEKVPHGRFEIGIEEPAP